MTARDCKWCDPRTWISVAVETRCGEPVCRECAREYDAWLYADEADALARAAAEAYGPETVFDADW